MSPAFWGPAPWEKATVNVKFLVWRSHNILVHHDMCPKNHSTLQCTEQAGYMKRSTSRKRRRLRETLVIFNELFIYVANFPRLNYVELAMQTCLYLAGLMSLARISCFRLASKCLLEWRRGS